MGIAALASIATAALLAAPGLFGITIGLGVDATGRVYVADAGNNRVQVFSSSGNHLAQWGYQGSGPGAFDHAVDVTVDGAGPEDGPESGVDRDGRGDRGARLQSPRIRMILRASDLPPTVA